MTRATIVGIAVIGLLCGCQYNPVTGKSEFSLMGPEEERTLGADADVQIVQSQGVVDDPALVAYVAEVGQRLVQKSHIPDQEFNFRVLDDPVVNAFALPGGYVYLTRGILAYIQDEGAMAGVLGHEIGHVAGRHSAQRYTRQASWQAVLGVGGALSEDFFGFGGMVGQAAGLFLLSYDRNQERQSDELGVKYATAAGYDTVNMGEFFGTLATLSGGSSRLPAWQSTHPDPGERRETIRSLTRAQQATATGPFRSERERYLQRIDGMAFGENPRHGFVSQGWFNHPEMAIRFSVPQGWQHQNGAAEFRMAPPGGRAIMSFSIAGNGSASAAADAFSRQQGVTPAERRDLSIGGYPAVEVVARVQSQDGAVDVVSTFIGLPRYAVAFNGMTAAGGLGAQRRNFEGIARSFQPLTDQALLGVQPVRVRTVRAPRAARFADLAPLWPIPAIAKLDLAGLALLNGLQPDTMVPAGAMLKIIAP